MKNQGYMILEDGGKYIITSGRKYTIEGDVVKAGRDALPTSRSRITHAHLDSTWTNSIVIITNGRTIEELVLPKGLHNVELYSHKERVPINVLTFGRPMFDLNFNTKVLKPIELPTSIIYALLPSTLVVNNIDKFMGHNKRVIMFRS